MFCASYMTLSTAEQAAELTQVSAPFSRQITRMAIVKPSLALQFQRDGMRDAASRFAVVNLRVFGSVLHGLGAEGRGVVLLVGPVRGTRLFDLGVLQLELEELLGVPVDLLTPGDLPRKFREQVLAEARPV